MKVEADMEYFTVQAVYEKGVLKPKKKLNLPEHSVVEIRVKAARGEKLSIPFASLIGIWEQVSERDVASLEKALTRTRRRSASKVKRITKTLK
jgi:predicted DNA-binding antitoxin AbrB/MazE fold protein